MVVFRVLCVLRKGSVSQKPGARFGFAYEFLVARLSLASSIWFRARSSDFEYEDLIFWIVLIAYGRCFEVMRREAVGGELCLL